jgi:hypothetical protein
MASTFNLLIICSNDCLEMFELVKGHCASIMIIGSSPNFKLILYIFQGIYFLQT